jgi:hypothetical protein
MRIKVDEPRCRIEQEPERLTIHVPPRRDRFTMVFLTVWLCGWLVGEVSASASLITHRVQPFVAFWLCLWTVGGGWAWFRWLWNLAGREIITVDRELLSVRRELFGVGQTREYTLSQVSALRPIEMTEQARTKGASVYLPKIALDYGPRTFRFCGAVDEAEARQLIAKIEERIEHFRLAPIALR